MGPELDTPEQEAVAVDKTVTPRLSPAKIYEARFNPDIVYTFVMDFLDDIAAAVDLDINKLPPNQNYGFNALVQSADFHCGPDKLPEYRLPNQVYVEFCSQIGTNLHDLVDSAWLEEHKESVGQAPSEDTYGA